MGGASAPTLFAQQLRSFAAIGKKSVGVETPPTKALDANANADVDADAVCHVATSAAQRIAAFAMHIEITEKVLGAHRIGVRVFRRSFVVRAYLRAVAIGAACNRHRVG
ncbi:DUF6053 domain-containing protein [Lysobacter capsici]|uniref:DUF6053 domain-containing protein n=1 Tax=Lysobacter capsici TaxID=435897 RepID=UPI003D2F7A83